MWKMAGRRNFGGHALHRARDPPNLHSMIWSSGTRIKNRLDNRKQLLDNLAIRLTQVKADDIIEA